MDTDNWLAEEHWQAAFRKDYDDWFQEDNDWLIQLHEGFCGNFSEAVPY
jgi:hypothetical protein